jgi:tetratricopeptide (TPR) repeat protein
MTIKPPKHIFKILGLRALYLLLLPILIWGIIAPSGIRAAIANNAWSISFIKHIFEPTQVAEQMTAPPNTHPHSGIFLAQNALNEGDLNSAKGYLLPLVDDSEPIALAAYADILVQQGEYAHAIQIWRDLKNEAALEQAAEVFREQNKPDLILLVFQNAYAFNPERYTTHLASTLKAVNDIPAAISILEQSINTFPNSENEAIWHHYLGDIYRDQGEYIQAESAYRQAVTVDPTYKRSWRNLGLMFISINDFEKAADCFREYIKVDPEDFSGYFYLAGTYEQAGSFEAAISVYQEVLELDPDDEQARQAIDRIIGMNGEN